MRSHILSIILFTPFLGVLLLLFIPQENKNTIRWVANLFGLAGFLISLALAPAFWAQRFETTPTHFKFIEGTPSNWIPSLGAGYILGIDGISFLLIMVTTLLGWISILSSWNAIENGVKGFYIWFLLLQTATLGLFMTLDLFLFFVFWEAIMVAIYFLTGIWGGQRRSYAAMKFFLYTQLGSALMLLGILFVYVHHHSVTGVFTFYIPALYETAKTIPFQYAVWAFLAFFIGFAIRVPMFPFHTWLPDALGEAPVAVSLMLAGVFLETGIYGFVRFLLPFFPVVVSHPKVRSWMIALSLIGIVYGAFISLVQKDMRRLAAYLSASQLGFCALGIFVLNPVGLTGSMLELINHGVSIGALFLMVGILSERRHTSEISEYGGFAKTMPILATITIIVFVSSMGLALISGFAGQLRGAMMANWRWTTWATLGAVFGAASLLWLYRRIFFGPAASSKNEKLRDLTPREVFMFVPLIAVMFWIGLYPKPFFQILEAPVNQIVQAPHDANEISPAAIQPKMSNPKVSN
jgi:NADH-quinone oxidoreductase subunit M